MRYFVMSDFRDHASGKPVAKIGKAGLPEVRKLGGPVFASLGQFEDLADAEARYSEAEADDVNDRIMLLDTADGSVLRRNFEGDEPPATA